MKKIFTLLALITSFNVNAQMDDNSANNNSAGTYAVAMGYSTTASGNQSTSMGWSTTASGYASTVNYQGLVPVLINALKEQQNEINRLKDQEKRIERLENLVAQLD